MTHKGKVKFYNSTKGFGFLINEETGEDIFVHATSLNNKEAIGIDSLVEYEEVDGKRGRMASNVTVIG